jgi:hypothetical protein
MPRVYQTFTVVGGGDFPFDMLRKDQCFPTDSVSAENMSEAGQVRHWARRRVVHLARWVDHALQIPTRERWRSFGWDLVTYDERGCLRSREEVEDLVSKLTGARR